jgi:hypothetical protein
LNSAFRAEDEFGTGRRTVNCMQKNVGFRSRQRLLQLHPTRDPRILTNILGQVSRRLSLLSTAEIHARLGSICTTVCNEAQDDMESNLYNLPVFPPRPSLSYRVRDRFRSNLHALWVMRLSLTPDLLAPQLPPTLSPQPLVLQHASDDQLVRKRFTSTWLGSHGFTYLCLHFRPRPARWINKTASCQYCLGITGVKHSWLCGSGHGELPGRLTEGSLFRGRSLRFGLVASEETLTS